MNKIYLLTDYKGNFGSKHNSIPYRSGMDKSILSTEFIKHGYEAIFKRIADVEFLGGEYKNQFVLYTSSEDIGFYYKNYIEDIIYGLELGGADLIPTYKYLKANNNKVFMEILRNQLNNNQIRNIKSHHFGCIEDIYNKLELLSFPVVIKSAAGAMSKGVYLAKSKDNIIPLIKKISKTKSLKYDFIDKIRERKHRGYVKDSCYRKKFIIQNFIEGLKYDWKVLIFGEKYYILKRTIKEGDFRASGSKFNYKFDLQSEFPNDIFNYCKMVYNLLDIPNASLDIAYDGNRYYLLEFQAIYFGTTVLEKSMYYFQQVEDNWLSFENDLTIEKAYVDSIIHYINTRYHNLGPSIILKK